MFVVVEQRPADFDTSFVSTANHVDTLMLLAQLVSRTYKNHFDARKMKYSRR